MGKKSRREGMAFELKVRKDLESSGWIVDKWTNNVEFPDDELKSKLKRMGKLHSAKSFRGITRSNGFPDFIAFKHAGYSYLFDVIGVEVKTNGYLSKVEKEKCQWYLDNNIFSRILIASKDGKDIVYKELELKSTSVKTEFERRLKK